MLFVFLISFRSLSPSVDAYDLRDETRPKCGNTLGLLNRHSAHGIFCCSFFNERCASRCSYICGSKRCSRGCSE